MKMANFEFETDSLFCFKIEEILQEHFSLGSRVDSSHMDMTIKTDTTSEITVYGSEKRLSAKITAYEISPNLYNVKLVGIDVTNNRRKS